MATTVGFIGLGTMGAAMAANLRAAGHDLIINDLNSDAGAALLAAGATWADSPAAVAAASEVVFTSLPGPPEVEEVALGSDGIVDGAGDGLAYFDLSTNSPTVMRTIGDRLAAHSVSTFDAPVSGGPAGAISGALAVWVGGDAAEFERWLPVLETFSDTPTLVGELGAGSIAKLVHNLSGYVLQTALAETFTMGVKAGVDAESLWRAVREGAIGRMRTFDNLTRNYLGGQFDPPSFALELAHKDVSLACALGDEFDVPMQLADATLAEMTAAMERGWARRDSRSAMLLQEERAGVEVRVSPDRQQHVLNGDDPTT